MTRNSRRLQKAVQAIFNDYREKASCPGQVYQNAACGCDNALQMWRGPKGEKGDTGPQGPKGDNAGSFLVDAEFVVDPEGQEPGAYLKLVLIDVAQQEQVVYVDLSYLTDIYEGGNGISIVDMVVAARLGAGLTFDANGNIASAYQFCDGLDETSNVVKVRLDASNRILGFASGTCGGLTATVGLAPSATGVNLVLTGANGAVLSTVPLEGGTGITVQKNAQTGGFTWLADPAGLVSSQTGNQLSVSQTDNKLYVGGNTLEYTFGTGAFTLKDSSGATLSSVTVPSAVRMLENMELRTDDGVYLHLTYLRDNGLHAYQDVSLDELLCNNVDTADDTAAAYSKAVPSGNWQTASINEVGGRTVVWNQLVQNGDFSDGTTGWTASNNTFGTYGASLSITEGELVISSTLSTNQMWGVKHSCNFNAGHKYAIIGNIRRVLDVKSDPDITKMVLTLHGDTTESVITYQTPSATTYSLDGIFTSTYNNSMFSLRTIGNIQLASASVAIFSILRLFIIDLTLMFGAGNEPATVAEFQSMFPAAYYPYNAGELRSAGVTDVESKGRNLIDKENVPFLNCYISTDGYITANAYDRLFYVPIEPNTVYTFQCALTLTDGTSLSVVDVFTGFTDSLPVSGLKCLSFNKYLAQQTISASYTSPATAKYFVCKIAQTQRVVLNATMDTVQLERGSTATAYTPYFSRTLPIPAAIQALPGYGWSAGTAYNVVSLAQGKNTQKVGSVDLGSLTYIKTSMGVGDVFVSTLSDAKPVSVNTDIFNGISSAFKTVSRATFNSTSSESLVALNTLAQLILYTTVSYTDATAFKSAMSGVMLQYELAAPVETGISSLLTDNLIEVEPGGTLTFKNQHGDAFRLPVPNSETFIYEHLWVFEDCVKGAMQPAIDALNARIDDVSVELITLDAECREVTVEPATAEPFDDYLLSGSINTLLLEPDGTISDLKHHNAIPDSSTVRGSVTMELFNPESTDGLSIELYAKQSSSSDSRNYYSNVDPEADAQKCATLADFLAAGEQGLPLTYADETSFSGVTPFAENETLYASVVSNGNNSYTFTFTVRTPEVVEQEPVLDLVSGENRTDLKPLLEHVGGKVTVPTLQKVTYWYLDSGVTPPYFAISEFDWAFKNENNQLVRANDVIVSDDYLSLTFLFYDAIPVSFDFGDYCGAAFTLVGGYTSQSLKAYANIKAIDASAQGSPYEMATNTLAEAYAAGDAGVPFYRVIMDDDTEEPVSVDLDDSIRVRFSPVNGGTGSFKVEVLNSTKTTLCLEPSCDSCIDLSPVMDTVDEMIDDKIAPIQEQITQNASDIAALQAVVEGITTDYTYALGAAVSAYYDTRRTGKVYQVKFPTWDTAHTVAGEKLLDNAGLVCVPSTDTVEGQDDYADIPMFQWVNVNYARNADGSPYPTAIEGSNAYKTTGSVDVGAMQMSFYYRVHVENGYQYWTVSDSPHPELNLVPWPECVKADGTVLPWCIGSKYMAGRAPDGTPRSLPGLDLWNRDMSYNNAVTYFHRKGAGYQGAGMEAGLFNLLFMVIKYATKNLNTVMYGCLYYTYYGYVALAETDATRILLPANDARFLANTYIQSGTSTVANRDRGYADAYDVCDHAKILSVEQVTVGGTTYTALNIDKTVTTILGGVVITTPFNAGATDSVLGHHDGSPVDNNSGHWPCRVQGREQFVGAWCLSCDVAMNTVTSLDQEIWWAPKGVTRSTNTTVIQDTYRNIGTAIGNSGTSFWIGDIDVYNGEGLWVPSKVGQSNSTGWCDHRWVSTSVGWREHLWGGHLGIGTYYGPVAWNANNALSSADWNYAARD